MEMILLHVSMEKKEKQLSKDVYFPSTFLKSSSPLVFLGKYVLVPDGVHCPTCYSFHGYPSHELSNKESNQFLQLIEHCPCHCSHIELPRYWVIWYNDYLNQYFSKLDRKFDSLETLMRENKKLDEKSWKLVKEIETTKESFSVGLVFQKLWNMPEGILEDCKFVFPKILNFLYKNRIGFVKGKYLIICTELLFRYCERDVNLFLQLLGQAYSLVQSTYCSISRMAIEAGFWQVCPEFGGFFWKHIDLKKKFSFLREFMQKNTIFIKKFSLSMGPYYLIGGGYFSYVYNTMGDLVVWYLPNFWHEDYFGFNSEEKYFFYNFKHFWYGIEKSEFGCHYNGVPQEACDYNMLQFLLEHFQVRSEIPICLHNDSEKYIFCNTD